MRSDRPLDRRPVRRPLGRSAVAAGALVVVLGLSSCATFENQRVASVNDHDFDQDGLEQLLESEVGQQIMQSAPIDGYATGDTVRGAISLWVLITAAGDAGLITDDDRTAARDTLGSSDVAEVFGRAPADVQEFAVDLTAAQARFNNGELTFDDLRVAALDADVSVDSFYGSWNDEVGSIVAMGTPASGA